MSNETHQAIARESAEDALKYISGFSRVSEFGRKEHEGYFTKIILAAIERSHEPAAQPKRGEVIKQSEKLMELKRTSLRYRPFTSCEHPPATDDKFTKWFRDLIAVASAEGYNPEMIEKLNAEDWREYFEDSKTPIEALLGAENNGL